MQGWKMLIVFAKVYRHPATTLIIMIGVYDA